MNIVIVWVDPSIAACAFLRLTRQHLQPNQPQTKIFGNIFASIPNVQVLVLVLRTICYWHRAYLVGFIRNLEVVEWLGEDYTGAMKTWSHFIKETWASTDFVVSSHISPWKTVSHLLFLLMHSQTPSAMPWLLCKVLQWFWMHRPAVRHCEGRRGITVLALLFPRLRATETCLSAASHECKGKRQPLSREVITGRKDNDVGKAVLGQRTDCCPLKETRVTRL